MSIFGAGGPRPIIPALGGVYPQAEQWGYPAAARRGGRNADTARLAEGDGRSRGGRRRHDDAARHRTGLCGCPDRHFLVGAALIILGFLTRPVALLLVIEFVIITYSHLTMGGWGVGSGGAEFAFLWLIVFVYILARGGGQYSVDAKLGKEF